MMKKIKSKLNQKGFSLIELMVVIVIMLILAAIAIPAFMGVIQDSRDSAATANARTVVSLAQLEVNKVEGTTGLVKADILKEAGITDSTEQGYFTIHVDGDLKVTVVYDNGNTSVTIPEDGVVTGTTEIP